MCTGCKRQFVVYVMYMRMLYVCVCVCQVILVSCDVRLGGSNVNVCKRKYTDLVACAVKFWCVKWCFGAWCCDDVYVLCSCCARLCAYMCVCTWVRGCACVWSYGDMVRYGDMFAAYIQESDDVCFSSCVYIYIILPSLCRFFCF